MEGGPKSLKAGLKLDDEGRDGEGTEEPGQRRRRDVTHYNRGVSYKNNWEKHDHSVMVLEPGGVWLEPDGAGAMGL